MLQAVAILLLLLLVLLFLCLLSFDELLAVM